MFTPAEREAIRTAILEKAQADPRLSGGAITGSKAMGNEDRWSDIDLAFGVRSASGVEEVLADYSTFMAQRFGVVDTLDVPSGAWIYRVFLLRNTLQVDLAFAPEEAFGARAPSFVLVFGNAANLAPPSPASSGHLIGMAWLYALHARTSLMRGKLWQAEHFISGLRGYVLTLACSRLGLPTRDGRGYDQLPPKVLASIREGVPASLEANDLQKAFACAARGLLCEVEITDPGLSRELGPVLADLTDLMKG